MKIFGNENTVLGTCGKVLEVKGCRDGFCEEMERVSNKVSRGEGAPR